jgi:hypothetical protein
MAFKYINFLVSMKTIRFVVPIMFPDKLVHSSVAAAMLVTLQQHFPDSEIKPVSAGLCGNLEVDGVEGESTTLHLKSQPVDADVINSYDYLHGIL